jgi:hypothetical protein
MHRAAAYKQDYTKMSGPNIVCVIRVGQSCSYVRKFDSPVPGAGSVNSVGS